MRTCKAFLLMCRLFRGRPASVATEFALVYRPPAGHANYGFSLVLHGTHLQTLTDIKDITGMSVLPCGSSVALVVLSVVGFAGLPARGFVGGWVAAPPTHQTPHSTNVLGGIAQMPAAAANYASGSVPSKDAIIEASRRAALATRAIKQAQAVAAVRASNSHADLMSQLG